MLWMELSNRIALYLFTRVRGAQWSLPDPRAHVRCHLHNLYDLEVFAFLCHILFDTAHESDFRMTSVFIYSFWVEKTRHPNTWKRKKRFWVGNVGIVLAKNHVYGTGKWHRNSGLGRPERNGIPEFRNSGSGISVAPWRWREGSPLVKSFRL